MTNDEVDHNVDHNIVEIWLRRDQKRWIAGAITGLLAALIMFFAVVVASLFTQGIDKFYLIRVFALPIVGRDAMNLSLGAGALLPGFALFGFLSVILGVVYAHMTGTNNMKALCGVGLTWGLFSWIFISNLFSPSFRLIHVENISPIKALGAWLIFGFSLTLIRWIDPLVRGD